MLNRRQTLQLSAGLMLSPSMALRAQETPAQTLPIIQRPIPSSGELLPAIGMGTSRTFDTKDDPISLAKLMRVMQVFFNGQGTIIDSSPMYGNAESRVGDILRAMPEQTKVFAASKVWTKGKERGMQQMQTSAQRMGRDKLDLIAVHNLRDWETQLATLKRWKAEEKVRYIGITTSHGRAHDEFLEIMANEPLDFVQFSYNIADRVAENKLLPLAQDRGIATMINRPYQRGDLFKTTRGQALPEVAADLDCDSWGQFFLKFILSHPAVTCIIPATSKAHHMADNMKANFGRVPDARQREEMLRIFESL